MTRSLKIFAVVLISIPSLLFGQDRICILTGEDHYKPEPLASNVLRAYADSVLTVNVVVHVVSNSIFNDIDDAAIHEQIEVLNQDYNRLNADTTDVPDEFKSLAGTVGIRFQLADRDTLGNPTTGITRTRTTIGNFWVFDRLQQTSEGGRDPWDQSKYLNIWVAQISSSLPGYSNTPDFIGSLQDGISIDYRAFGTSGRVREPFLKGRTATHELGHYFGLKHIWGPTGAGCVEDDGISDTPNQSNSTGGCIIDQQSCGSRDMRTNFMDYTNDVCMNLFTREQADRMRNTLLTVRSSLLAPLPVSSSADIPMDNSFEIEFFPNPSYGELKLSLMSNHGTDPNLDPSQTTIQLFDLMGREVFRKLQLDSSPEVLQLGHLPNGQYLLRVSNGSQTSTKSVQLFTNSL